VRAAAAAALQFVFEKNTSYAGCILENLFSLRSAHNSAIENQPSSSEERRERMKKKSQPLCLEL
jgi:hypothetical protein